MSKLPVRDMKGKQVGEFDLADDLLVFDKGLQAMHDAVVAYQAHQRAGSASTLTKAEVAGSNKKPWRQKGLGRARAGYRQSPVWRGGGVTFGPKPRKYQKKMTRKTAKLAFRRAFSEKVAAGAVVVLDEMAFSEPKTKEMAAVVKSMEAEKGALIVVDTLDMNLALSARNIPKVELTTAADVNTYQLLRYPVIIVTKKGMAELEKRLKAPAGRGE